MPTRRTHLAALGLMATAPIITAGTPAAAAPAPGPGVRAPGAAPAPGPGARAPLELSARRTEITLPPGVPNLGLTYIALLDLFDTSGAKVGQASTSSFVVEVTTGGPIVLGFIVLQLDDGDIHYQRLIRRYGDYPRTATGAITGGTGEYASGSGHVDVSWPDAERVDLVVHLA